MNNCVILVDDGNLCGEAPIWDGVQKRLYWADCLSSKLFVYDWTARRRDVVLDGFEVNGIALAERGGFVFTNNRGIWLWNGLAEAAPVPIATQVDGIRLQLNDCVADPRGRVLAGTCFYTPFQASPSGHLVKVDVDGSVEILDEGLKLANGLSFSPDASTLYFADSIERIIYAYAYDTSTGRVSGKRVFVRIDPSAGLPDGVTVDAEGFVWSAEWYGGCIKRYDPDGKLERCVVVPAKQTSSLAFGGPDLQDIFVTSAARPEPMPAMPPGYDAVSGYFGGALFGLSTEIRGLQEHRVNISVSGI